MHFLKYLVFISFFLDKVIKNKTEFSSVIQKTEIFRFI